MDNLPNRAILSALLLFLLPETGLADTDWKTFPGAHCQAGHRHESVDYDSFGGICNTSTRQNVVVHCPVVRDMSQSRFPIMIRHAGRSGNPDVPMRCRLRNMKRSAHNSGSAMEFEVIDLEEIESGAATTIRYRETDLYWDTLDAEDWGAHVLTCDLPESKFIKDHQQVLSCLYNYSIQEWDGQ